MRTSLALLLLQLVACASASRPASSPTSSSPSASTSRSPLALTYLGVAGWQLEGDEVTVLADPYFSRPDLDQPISPDLEAIARHAPARADVIVIGHTHVDHVLDAPEVAKRTGAQLVGSRSTALYAKAAGLPDDQIIPVKGGEDYAFERFSVRVIPSLHSALDHKHTIGGELTQPPTLPMKMDDFAEGGTFAYLVRLAGHEVIVLSTANFIERELEGLRPDIAIVGVGLRQEIHDYSCRLMRVLGYPEVVLATHFDDWQSPPPTGEVPRSPDLEAFVAEIQRCSPKTRVIVPRHFERMTLP